MKSFQDKVIVITGAASGIGRALSTQFAAENAILVLIDKDMKGLETTKSLANHSNPIDIHLFEADVSNRERIYEIADWVMEILKRVDVVINNAGVALEGYLNEVDYEEIEWLMNINFWGVMYGTKAYLPHFMKQNSGYLVNISSLFGLTGVAGNATYCASKFAVRGLTESLRAELMETDINVMSVHPGGIKTNIVRNSRSKRDPNDPETEKLIARTEAAFKTTAKDAAATIIKGIRKKKNRVLIGKDARAADKILRLLPVRAIKIFYDLSAGLRQKSVPKS